MANTQMLTNEILINPVQESVVNILSMMADLLPRTEEPKIKSGDFDSGDVTGIIDLISENRKGSIAVSFSKPVALEIARRMLGIDSDASDDEIMDLVGEITNMMAGGAKAKLSELGYDFDMTIPYVMVDEDNNLGEKAQGPTIILPFATDSGKFYVELCFIEEA